MSTTPNITVVTLSWVDVINLADEMKKRIAVLDHGYPLRAYGIPRGGANVVALLHPAVIPVGSAEEADIVIDDLIDSGGTMDSVFKEHEHLHPASFFALIDKRDPESPFHGKWVVFPWELDTEAHAPEENVRRILSYIGEDPDREGLRDTPKRFLKAMREYTEGYAKDPKAVLGTSFDLTDTDPEAVYDQIILSGPLPFSSMCEHHMAPFEGHAWIAYLPSKEGRVVGLSKLARVLDIYAKRLQVQERMTTQIANAIEGALGPQGVGVIIKARHTCQCNRGIKKDGRMVTSIVRGCFHDAGVKAELMSLIELANK